jgi:hypothetical protein
MCGLRVCDVNGPLALRAFLAVLCDFKWPGEHKYIVLVWNAEEFLWNFVFTVVCVSHELTDCFVSFNDVLYNTQTCMD